MLPLHITLCCTETSSFLPVLLSLSTLSLSIELVFVAGLLCLGRAPPEATDHRGSGWVPGVAGAACCVGGARFIPGILEQTRQQQA